jgi:adenylate kinase family enzyme
MDLLTVIFIGRSGCGKGTQVEKLSEYLKSDKFAENEKREIFHLESGERFRQFIKGDSYASKIANAINEKGGLQPEFLSVWVWTSEIVENLTPTKHLVLDGTPRRVVEAKILETMFEFYSRPNVQVVYLNVSEDWAMDRAKERGRSDDVDLEDVETRMKWFNSDVVPVLDYYRAHKAHTFHEINGEQSIEKVHEDVLKSLGI